MKSYTFLFTDIEGSTRLWEHEPARMRPALARHNALTRSTVEANRGIVVKMTGDGVYAAFNDAIDAVAATLQLQCALADTAATSGLRLRVRCGLHAGDAEREDGDFYGGVVNRAARIMSAAHGGQVLLSKAVADAIADRLPENVSLRDLGSARLRDLASPERVFQVLHPDLRADFPALRSLESTPNNLPQQVSSFIGRERELATIKALLAGTRLLTLLGAGGLGKTRLSLQAAADSIDEYEDGVWFVELAPLTDSRLVPQAVATVLGLQEEAGRPVLEALVRHVRDRAMLLILDNCEHLLPVCGDLARQLLQAGARLKILASSREPLHLAGEATYPVPPLAVPDAGHRIAVAALAPFDAVRLFATRALASRPAFQLTDANAASVAEICRRLDGIPLAIELAAARVRAMSTAQIAARIEDRFRLLTRGDHSALPRQQTLRACIDWSYDLLAVRERKLLRRLAVFAGGFTLDAAEYVGSDDELDAADVLDLLTHLVEKSLVTLEADGERYAMLETIRQYAAEKLHECSEATQARGRHLDFYLALAEEAEPQLFGPDQRAWFVRLDLERENLLAGLRHCGDGINNEARGLRLTFAIRNYWLSRGLLESGYRLTTEMLARSRSDERSLVRCQVLSTAGHLAFYLGRYDDAIRFGDDSLAIARELGDRLRTAVALGLLGSASFAKGDRAAARDCFDESLALARELGDALRLSNALLASAELHRADANLDAANLLYEESLALARRHGNRDIVATNLLNLALVSLARGEIGATPALLHEAMTIVEETGSKRTGQYALEVLSCLCAQKSAWPSAARFYGASEEQREQIGYRREPVDEAFLAPLVARTREALGAEAFTEAETCGRALGYDSAMAEARAWVAARLASLSCNT